MSAVPRSSRREVRNPILALPAAKRIMALPLETRAELAGLLIELSQQSRGSAEHAWTTRKPPMAAYYASSAVIVKHIAHVLRLPEKRHAG